MNRDLEHCEEFCEVAQKMPTRYSSYIIYGLMAFVSILLILSFIIEIPESVFAEVRVMSTNPPITLNAQTSGKIHLIENNSFFNCKKGQYLAVIDNPANFIDVQSLKNWLNNHDIFNHETDLHELEHKYMLGDIEADFYVFKIALLKYNQIIEGRSDYQHSLVMIDKQVEGNEKAIEEYQSMLQSYANEFDILSYYQKSDSTLYNKRIIPKDEFDNSKVRIIEVQNKMLSIRKEISQAQNNISQYVIKRAQVIDGIDHALNEAKIALYNSYYKLLIKIKEWEKTYVFIAPDDCHAEFAGLISNGSFVTAGEPVYNIIYGNNSYFGIAVLPSEGSGNVTIGDSVNLRMMLYPFREYGSLRGYIDRISQNTIDRGYLVYINLPNGLKSDCNRQLAFAESMYGQAEIITDRKRLIFILFNRMKSLGDSKEKSEINSPNQEENSASSNLQVLNNF